MTYEASTDLEVETPAATKESGFFGRLVDGLNGVGSIVIVLTMALMCADVFLRNLANLPLAGVAELVASSIVVVVFLQLPATLRHGRMSRADLFIDPFILQHPRAGRWLRAVFSMFGIFACAVIFYASIPLLAKAWTDSEFLGVEGAFTFPTWPMRAVVVLGSLLASVQYALLSWRDLGEESHE